MKSIEDSFDTISYTKGENVLKMLSFYIGEEKFRNGLKNYLKSYSYGNATYLNLFQSMEQASGVDLTKFRDSWILKRGYPIVKYSGEWDGATHTYKLTVKQSGNQTTDSHTFHFKLPVSFHDLKKPTKPTTQVVLMDQAEQKFEFKLAHKPAWVSLNRQNLALAKIAPEEKNINELCKQATGDSDALIRLWASTLLMEPLHKSEAIGEKEQQALLTLATEDKSVALRAGVLSLLQKVGIRYYPAKLANGLLDAAKKVAANKKPNQEWAQWESELVGTLGKVPAKGTATFLISLLKQSTLPIDPLGKGALSLAGQGTDEATDGLHAALEVHQTRGYPFRYALLIAFGAYESPKAATEIKKLTLSEKSDFVGRIGWIISNNHTLRNSQEWSAFLQEFIVSNQTFSDEVKVRLLQTIEGVKNEPVEKLLNGIEKASNSERLRSLASQIKKKDFPNSHTP